jgi:hypothetical protein
MLWRFLFSLCVFLYSLIGGVIGLTVAVWCAFQVDNAIIASSPGKDDDGATLILLLLAVVVGVPLGLALGAAGGLAITGKLKRKKSGALSENASYPVIAWPSSHQQQK